MIACRRSHYIDTSVLTAVSTSPVKPDTVEYTVEYRLIADDGKALTDGTIITGCVDVESPDGWTEIDALEDKGEEVRIALDAE